MFKRLPLGVLMVMLMLGLPPNVATKAAPVYASLGLRNPGPVLTDRGPKGEASSSLLPSPTQQRLVVFESFMNPG